MQPVAIDTGIRTSSLRCVTAARVSARLRQPASDPVCTPARFCTPRWVGVSFGAPVRVSRGCVWARRVGVFRSSPSIACVALVVGTLDSQGER
jgi:hypothetical protein